MTGQRKREGSTRDTLIASLQLVFGIIGGVLICAVWLMWKPVRLADGPSAGDTAEDPHQVAFVRGREPIRSSQGARKHKAFLERRPGEITMVEEDVNRWLSGVYGVKERTFKLDAIDLTLDARAPVVRFDGDEAEIGVELAMDRADTSRTFIAQARGRFVSRDDGPVFVPRTIHLNSCPLPWNLGGRLFFKKLQSLYPVAENVAAAWSAVTDATVRDGRLHLTMAGAVPSAAAATVEVEPAAAVAAPAATEAPAPASIAPAEPVPGAVESVEEADSSAEGAPADADADADEGLTAEGDVAESAISPDPAVPVETPQAPAETPGAPADSEADAPAVGSSGTPAAEPPDSSVETAVPAETEAPEAMPVSPPADAPAEPAAPAEDAAESDAASAVAPAAP